MSHTILSNSPKTFVYIMYGLGGSTWSDGMETVLGRMIRNEVPNVSCPPTRRYQDWQEIVDEIKKQPSGSKTVVAGHSMGAGSSTYVTDHVYVDLVVLFDTAGQRPSKIGKNTGKCIDIYDMAFAMVPKYRVQAVYGHENKIIRWHTNDGHTRQDNNEDLMKKVVSEIRKLT